MEQRISMLYKSVEAEVKALDDKGTGQAIISTFGVADLDDDVTLANAYGNEQVVPIVPTHTWSHPPIGKSRLREMDNRLVADFSLNLQMVSGLEWYQALKFDLEGKDKSGQVFPAKQEWSYGFKILDSEMGTHDGKNVRFLKKIKVYEISPVLVAAGIGTSTVSLKSASVPNYPFLTDEEKQEGFAIQTLIFPKAKWDSAAACRAWCSSHDFSSSNLDETESSYRFRQKEPNAFTRLRTICLAPNRDAGEDCRVQAVGGPLKESRADESNPTHLVDDLDDILLRMADVFPKLLTFKHMRDDQGRPLPRGRLEQVEALIQQLTGLKEGGTIEEPPAVGPATDTIAAAAVADILAKLDTRQLHV